MIHRPSRLALALLIPLSLSAPTRAATVSWAGHTWNVTTGGMAGNNTGSASNVTVDANGYLHLKISQSNGKWLCAELFTTDTLGFGTYQWQIDAPVDKLDKNVVLGLFPYGPIAGTGADGTNEIDIEYARWGDSSYDIGNYTVYPNSGTTVGQTTFDFKLNGTYTTSSFVWSSSSIRYRTQEGFKAVGDSSGTIQSWTYAPTNPAVDIPQKAVPLGMNLWLCSECTQAPSDGKPVEVVVRSFVHLAPGATSLQTRGVGGAAGEVQVLQNGRSVQFLFAEASALDRVLQVLDLNGRRERTLVAPRGARGISVGGLSNGMHALLDPTSRIHQVFPVTESP